MTQQYHDIQYLNLVSTILKHGVRKPNRTGIDTLSIFGYQMPFDVRDRSIPLLTTKKIHTKSIIHELLWFLAGDTNIKYLNDNGVTIWDEWADAFGDLGPVYGAQWRKWPKYTIEAGSVNVVYVDQIKILIDELRNNPNSRRLLVDAWNVSDLDYMALPPCHRSFQCYTQPVEVDGVTKHELSMLFDQRSCDVGLGVPFNIAQYAILLNMLCHVTDMVPGDLIWNGGDVHIYVNHIDKLKEQLLREPFPSPTLQINCNRAEIDEFKYTDFLINQYECHPAIQMVVAV